jgi:hypothetical protein
VGSQREPPGSTRGAEQASKGAVMNDRRQIELWDYDFDKCRELERERLRSMPDVPALKIYDALLKYDICTSDRFAIMADLGCKCDQEGDGLFLRIAWVDSQGRLLD